MRVPRGASRRVMLAATLVVLAVTQAACTAPMSFVAPKSPQANAIQGIQIIVFWLAVVVFAGVLLATVFFSLRFRERPGREARQFHGNTRLEVLWTLIPVVIVVIIAVPTFDTMFAASKDPPEDALTIDVVGHQWWFEFRYADPNGPIERDGRRYSFITANELRVPQDRAVSFRLQTVDVIHSFWVPQLFGKTDVMPGHENTLWFTATTPGEYFGHCVEFCGASHAKMRFRLYVDAPDEYAAWARTMSSDRRAPSGAAAQGEQVFLRQACIGCHTVQGTIAQAQVGPNLTHVGSRNTLAAGIIPNTPDMMAKWIRNSGEIKPGSAMPAFTEAQLSAQDLEAIVSFLQSLE